MYNYTTASLPARIDRTTFLIRGGLLLVGGLVAGGVLSMSHHAPLLIKIIFITGGVSLLLFLFVALFRSILIPRLRDMGLHPAWALLVFVHALNSLFLLALLVLPTNAFAKRSYLPFR